MADQPPCELPDAVAIPSQCLIPDGTREALWEGPLIPLCCILMLPKEAH